MAKKGQYNPSTSLGPLERDRDYQGESDHSTMMRAAEIQGDKGRMAGVKRHHAKQAKAFNVLSRNISQKGRF